MTRKLVLASCLLLFVTYASYSKTWRVNNNNNISADFKNIQTAHDNANPGDTLHIESSSINYGSLNMSKKLILIGTGYFLDLNPNLQAGIQASKISWISLNHGSEGSVIMGLDFETGYINVYANNVVIKRNKFSRTDQSNLDYITGYINLHYSNNDSSSPLQGVEISQNMGLVINGTYYVSTGVLIKNNFLSVGSLYGEDPTNGVLNLHPGTTAIIQNNVFRRGTVTAYNSSVINNIMYNGFFTGSGNLIGNNISSKEQFGVSNGNKVNIDMTTVFAGGSLTDAYWKLKAGSPASGAGYGSTAEKPVDCGMFGSSSPYVISGIPSVPAVYFFSNQPVGSANDPIKVTVKVRSNN